MTLLLSGSQSFGKPALQAGPCPSVCSAWPSLTMPVLSVQTKVTSLLQSKCIGFGVFGIGKGTGRYAAFAGRVGLFRM